MSDARRVRGWLLTVAVLLFGQQLWAQDAMDQLQIHGIGTWYYGKDYGASNPYKGLSPDGNWENLEFNLNASKPLSDKLDATFQVRLRSQELDNTRDVRIDLAQLSWRPQDSLLLRAGRLKQPWGLYAEEWRAATPRPFFDVPYAQYGPLNAVLPAVDGVAMTYQKTGRVETSVDVYGGQMSGETILPLYTNGVPAAVSTRTPSYWKNIIGGRVTLASGGLRVGVNYTYARQWLYDFRPLGPTYLTDPNGHWGVFAALNRGGWWLRGEYSQLTRVVSTVDGVPASYMRPKFYYAEGARRVGKAQLALRHSYSRAYVIATVPGSDGDGSRDTELSASYYLSTNAVVRLSHTWTDGRCWQQYSQEQLNRGLATHQWEPHSHYFQVGVQFGF